MRLLALSASLFLLIGCGDDAPADPGSSGMNGGGGAGNAGAAATGGDSAGGAGGDAGSGSFSEPIIVDLGPVSAGTPVPFEIPAGTLGFHVAAASPAPNVAVTTVLDPASAPVLELSTPVGGTYASAVGLSGFAGAAVPANAQPSTIPVTPGTWSAELDGNDITARVYIQHTDDGAFHGGELDLHVYIAEGLVIHDPDPAHEVSADSAPADAAVTARIDAFYEGLATFFGIGRGEVFFHPLPATFLSVSGQPELNALFSQSIEVSGGQALHVMWAQNVEPFPGYPIWGIAPGIPGNVLEAGTASSAITLALFPDFNAKADALTMLHEMGHFLGLQHTTEMDGSNADPVADTPLCADIDPATLALCPDKTNLMFPVFYGATGGIGVTVTSTQTSVVRGSAVYRAFSSGAVAQGDVMAVPPRDRHSFQAALDGSPLASFIAGRLCGSPRVAVRLPALDAAGRAELARLAGDTAFPIAVRRWATTWQADLARTDAD